MFYDGYFKSSSRDGLWKLAVATNAVMHNIGKLLYNSLFLPFVPIKYTFNERKEMNVLQETIQYCKYISQ